MIKIFDECNIYFPDYYENGKQERIFLISILSTINSDALKPHSVECVDEKDNLVEIDQK